MNLLPIGIGVLAIVHIVGILITAGGSAVGALDDCDRNIILCYGPFDTVVEELDANEDSGTTILTMLTRVPQLLQAIWGVLSVDYPFLNAGPEIWQTVGLFIRLIFGLIQVIALAWGAILAGQSISGLLRR